MDSHRGRLAACRNPTIDTSGLPAAALNPGQTGQDAIMSRLQPQIDRQRSQLETQLANQGVMPGSEAYNNAMTDQNQRENDLLSQAALYGINTQENARQQALQEKSFLQSQPINLLNSVLNGTQVTNPSLSGTPAAGNFMGAANNTYNAQLGQYNAGVAQQNNLLNGLFGIGAAALMA